MYASGNSHSLLRLPEDVLVQWSQRTGIAVEVWAFPKEDMPDDIAALVHAVIDDVLAEIEKYALAKTVSVALTITTSGLRLTVGDDGAGMPINALEKRLAAKRAQIVALGGRLTVNSVREVGTTVSGTLPGKAPRKSRTA